MAGGLFTSQLSVDGFALCAPSGVVPVSQVMGSCVFYLGRGSTRAYEHLYGPIAVGRRSEHARAHGVELTGVSAGFNDARTHALDRPAGAISRRAAKTRGGKVILRAPRSAMTHSTSPSRSSRLIPRLPALEREPVDPAVLHRSPSVMSRKNVRLAAEVAARLRDYTQGNASGRKAAAR
jgi:hypothetical protein